VNCILVPSPLIHPRPSRRAIRDPRGPTPGMTSNVSQPQRPQRIELLLGYAKTDVVLLAAYAEDVTELSFAALASLADRLGWR
jgi:hypothetical protein